MSGSSQYPLFFASPTSAAGYNAGERKPERLLQRKIIVMLNTDQILFLLQHSIKRVHSLEKKTKYDLVHFFLASLLQGNPGKEADNGQGGGQAQGFFI